MTIPEEYIIQKFYQHAGYPKFIKTTNTYMGGCPVCREGNSWGRKSRCYYIPRDMVICCHNCGWYSKPINWVMEVEKISYKELLRQVNECDYEYGIPKSEETIVENKHDLPRDSINLFDKTQLEYYSKDRIVMKAIETIIRRRLHLAANRPQSLYVSLVDNIHKDRLIIPFYDQKNKCVFYQSRKMLEVDDKPKYLSKINSEKTLFNYNNVSTSAEDIFITEGPIDSFFLKNSVAVAGIQERSNQTFTTMQRNQIERLFLMQSVWVLDSQWNDQASKTKTEILLKGGECVFIWPKDVGTRFKDINDLCMHFKLNEISSSYIKENTYCGLKGIVRLKQIK
mgnify:CR=1 FL=1|jgi:hypothetical protein